ncbi:MAG: response regulator [Patescibacteria group bacterium]
MKKVLVVEDEAALRSALCDALRDEGITVLEASNGEEALQLLRTEEPDLMLLDNLMPVMDGASTLQAMKDDDSLPRCRVIMLTNLNEIEALNESLVGGATDYLIKSDTGLDEVVKIVQGCFSE